MKRFVIAALAAAALLGPISVAAPAAADNGHRGGHGHDNDGWRDRDRDDDDHHWRGGHDRDHHNGRWDDRRHNGHYRHGQWYYGPPPPAYYSDSQYGYRSWRRGDQLPHYYRQRYRQVDYRYYHLAPPPYGYHYVRNDDNGELLLVGIATGVILGIILAGN